jgi:RNA polymerase sigma-70 factor, ECF subfamily
MTHPRVDLVDERSLLAAARAGDERAFGRLVERHREGLEHFCLLMLGDRRHAKCVLEESVLCAWRERELVEPIATGRLWLYRFAVLACLEDLDARR